jgi:superfamily II DNA/RNA helicase
VNTAAGDPAAAAAFAALGLSAALARAAVGQGYAVPTPVQAAAIPAALQGSDLIAIAPTGSGKTGAFGLALLQRLDGRQTSLPVTVPARVPARAPVRTPVLALVLVPTRELAVQVGEVLRALSQGCRDPVKLAVLFGGVSVNPQMMSLRGGADVVVATPGRLLDLVERRALRLDDVELLVLDEADRLLDEGFADELARVKALLPLRWQGLFCSATFAPAVQALAQAWLHQPLRLDLTPAAAAAAWPETDAAAPAIEQRAIEVDAPRRTALLRHLIHQGRWPQVLVFVATRYASEHVADKLRHAGLAAAAFHGDLSQGARTRVLADFGAGALQVLLATDMAARGLHIPGLPVVVNHDLPRSATEYTHRIGRTARAGAPGLALSFISADTEAHFRLIEKRQGRRVPRERIAGFEPTETVVAPPTDTTDPAGTGGIKGRRKSRKDKLREAAAGGC